MFADFKCILSNSQKRNSESRKQRLQLAPTHCKYYIRMRYDFLAILCMFAVACTTCLHLQHYY